MDVLAPARETRATQPTEVRIENREQLIYTLTEAAEVEHNLMCSYLYAAFSMKTREDEGLTSEQLAAVRDWRRAIINVAVEEMSHLAIVSNLMVAVGGSPHLTRPNFPVSAGYHPAGVQARLTPFDPNTLQHFVYLERPHDSDEPEGKGFEPEHDYHRKLGEYQRLMPSGQYYSTVGELYGALQQGLETLCEMHGEDAVFIAGADMQVGHDIIGLPGLTTISSLAEAIEAIDVVVEQGEGAPADSQDGHFQAFVNVRTAYDAMRERDPNFRPARPAAFNPVMREPVTPGERVWVNAREAATVMDYGNALYGLMLRLMTQAFGRKGDVQEKQLLMITATELMYALTPAAEYLTTLPANDTDDCNAGLSFATLKAIRPLPQGAHEWIFLEQRFGELEEVARDLSGMDERMEQSATILARVATNFRSGLAARELEAV